MIQLAGEPSHPAALHVLNKALGRAGIRREDCVHRDANIVIALGDRAAAQWISDWPAKSMHSRRGFFWFENGQKVLTTIDPSAIVTGGAVRGTNNVIQEYLLASDLRRAKEESGSPESPFPDRTVHVVSTEAEAKQALSELAQEEAVACDIEIRDVNRTACIGFASSAQRAFVFTERVLYLARELLESDRRKPNWVFQNGSFDLYFLGTRDGIRGIPSYRDDTIIQFHTLFPELAGASSAGSKRSQKSLNFLASLYAKVPYWKDYDFANDSEMYELNGIDCMVTWEIHQRLKEEHKRWQIDPRIYHHEMSLVPVVVDILARGIRVDEEARLAALKELKERAKEASEGIAAVAVPALEAKRADLSRPNLFWKSHSCSCCGGGSAKRDHCWSCAGFEGAPTKAQIEDRFGNPNGLKAAELKASVLLPCRACGGEGSSESFTFNPRSDAQKKILLYEALKLPKRYNDGRLSTDESKLKDLLPLAKGDKREILLSFLRVAKLETMRRIYERLSPGPDGRIRTSLSVVGTDTGRLSSSKTFLEVSTNLQNIPKKTAKLEPLYDIRRVLVPSRGMVLIEGDYSQIEARITSALAMDRVSLQAFERGDDIHRRTASTIFGTSEQDVTWEQRHLGKMARHGLNYGMGWKQFMKSINKDADLTGISVSAAHAKEICDGYRRMSPEVVRWWDDVMLQVRNKGFLTNPFGRKRVFFDRSDSIRNAAIAYLPQSTAADHVNRALVRAHEAGLTVLLQIHDAILIEAPRSQWRSHARKLKEIMLAEPIVIDGTSLEVPVDVSASSRSWGEMKEVKI